MAGGGLSRTDCIAIAIATALLVALAIWLISPRFSLTGPTLVDDWSNLDNAPRALDELQRLSYDPAEVHDTRRYRPAYTAVWSSLQWNTLGGPEDMTGPNFWAIVRLALLVAGLVLLTAFSLTIGLQRRLKPMALAFWSAVPALLLLTTPTLTLNLARQGPSEPLMLGAMAVGGALVLIGLRRLLAGSTKDAGRWAIAVALAAIAIGYALWLLGLYQKEASICALVLLGFLYFVLDRRWRSEGVIDRPLHRHWPLRIVAVLLVLPLLHVLYEISRVTEGGETVYGADVPSGLSGWVTRLWDSAEIQWNAAEALGTSQFLGISPWIALAAAMPWLVLGWVGRNRRMPWLAIGLIATAVALYLFQGLAGVAVSRYFIPVVALMSVSAILLVMGGPAWLRALAIAGVVAVVISQGPDVRDHVRGWADQEQLGLDAVEEVARLNPDHCEVYMALFHAEDADAFPELVERAPRPRSTRCNPEYVAYMIQGRTALPTVTNEAIYATCAKPGWVKLRLTPVLVISGCHRFTKRRVYGQPPDDVLRWNRLVPGQRMSERIHSLPDRALCESPLCTKLLAEVRKSYR